MKMNYPKSSCDDVSHSKGEADVQKRFGGLLHYDFLRGPHWMLWGSCRYPYLTAPGQRCTKTPGSKVLRISLYLAFPLFPSESLQWRSYLKTNKWFTFYESQSLCLS